jgi:hypothetical protein
VLNTLGYCMDFKLTRLARLTTSRFRAVMAFCFGKRKRKSDRAAWSAESAEIT